MPSTVRALSLDAAATGPHIGFAQIKILRAIMRELWREKYGDKPTEAEVDSMRPSEYFDIIFGGGTGGVLAVYLGRLHLTMRACEDNYKRLGDEVYAHPASPFNPRRLFKYDHNTLECVLREQTSDDAGVPLDFADKERGCKAIVLTKRCHNAQTVHLIESCDINSGRAWEAIRATTAVPFKFPIMKVAGHALYSPETGASNPAAVAWDTLIKLYPPRKTKKKTKNTIYPPTLGLCLISIGGGIQPAVKLHSSSFRGSKWSAGWWKHWANKIRFIIFAIRLAAIGKIRQLPQIQDLTAIATKSEAVDKNLRNTFNSPAVLKNYFAPSHSGYFRFDFQPDILITPSTVQTPHAAVNINPPWFSHLILYLGGIIWALFTSWTGARSVTDWNRRKSMVEQVAYNEYSDESINPIRMESLTSAAKLLLELPSNIDAPFASFLRHRLPVALS